MGRYEVYKVANRRGVIHYENYVSEKWKTFTGKSNLFLYTECQKVGELRR